MQKSKVYLRFSQHGRLIEPPVYILGTSYLVTWSLYRRPLRIVNLLPAEDEDLTVAEELGTLYFVTWYLVHALWSLGLTLDVELLPIDQTGNFYFIP